MQTHYSLCCPLIRTVNPGQNMEMNKLRTWKLSNNKKIGKGRQNLKDKKIGGEFPSHFSHCNFQLWYEVSPFVKPHYLKKNSGVGTYNPERKINSFGQRNQEKDSLRELFFFSLLFLPSRAALVSHSGTRVQRLKPRNKPIFLARWSRKMGLWKI